jgi:ketosteroid isomerase-like protein
MSDHDIEANKALARRFMIAINTRDYATIEALLHPDFIWNTAVADDGGPNELRPLQSNRLKGTNMPHPKPRLNRDETLQFFAGFLSDNSGAAIRSLADDEPLGGLQGSGDHGHMHIDILTTTAEEDRVAMEAKSSGIANPANGRRYGNFYHLLFRIRDGKIVLYKEYQDTLHVYDYVAD